MPCCRSPMDWIVKNNGPSRVCQIFFCAPLLIFLFDTFTNYHNTVLDSTGLGDAGYMTRLAIEFGDYDQCLAVNVDTPKFGDGFKGQYCLYRIHFPLPPRIDQMPEHLDISTTDMAGTWVEKTTYYYKYFYFEKLSAALCFPSACKPSEIQPILQYCKYSAQSDISHSTY